MTGDRVPLDDPALGVEDRHRATLADMLGSGEV